MHCLYVLPWLPSAISMWLGASIGGAFTLVGFFGAAVLVLYFVIKLVCCLRSSPPSHETDSENTSVRTLNGLEPCVIASLPIIIHQSLQQAQQTGPPKKCPICLEEFHTGNALRVLPWCTHSFHVECIDHWLRQNATCPVCRMSLRESPDGTNHGGDTLDPLHPSPMLRFSSPEIQSARSSLSSFHTGEGEDIVIPRQPVANPANRAMDRSSAVVRVPNPRRQSASKDRWNLRYWRKNSGAGESSNAAEVTINISIDLRSAGRSPGSEGPSTI
ncbi:RING-H2 finger protein ATL32 [Selaginella moellendorffii]|uniref:RING-H2 finger protein ATL32 n=1 Tax=Selaginella moellendorffii TaxID=88036 RepID=UPI000D1D0B24|nr:RING-H2 finger protein ATL32 [Selaginella moellendorffii]|eukprot:XP_002978203.2 RING-H2 finger protein ATL32 [Selaginella moellendorffii]